MPKIIVSLADPEEQEAVTSALRMKRYDILALPPMTAADNPKAILTQIMDAKASVAVLDYIDDDAFSVKLLQSSTDYARFPRFIFGVPAGLPTPRILMAVNEGASALLERPVNTEALVNYVERAISGPARFRYEMDKDSAAAQELRAMEEEAKATQMRLASDRKLISYLMAVPAANQHRTAMVVSDSAYQRDNLKKLLEDHGFQVCLAQHPAEALDLALQERPRVVISDLEMEGKNGVEFCHDLKIEHKYMPCFFIICTANTEKVDSIMAPGNGVDGCVPKPSDERANHELIATAAMGLLL
jgi:twitching motility two-component system response regulator PilH